MAGERHQQPREKQAIVLRMLLIGGGPDTRTPPEVRRATHIALESHGVMLGELRERELGCATHGDGASTMTS